jgi:RIO kinase 1
MHDSNQDFFVIESAIEQQDDELLASLDRDEEDEETFDFDEEEEVVRWEPIHKPVRKPKQSKKTSFESNADVQRWLKDQGLTIEAKPRFNPSFLASQRDAPWILSSLTPLYDQDLITDIIHIVKSGKEATVFCCRAHPSTGMEYLAVKVYRPRMFRSLKNDTDYRHNRAQRDEQGRVVYGSSKMRGVARKTVRGRAVRVLSWIEYEFDTLNLLYNHGAHVPKPVAQIGNAVLMGYVGEVGTAAPLLRDVRLQPEEAQPLFDKVMRDIELYLTMHRVHGDLSEYNILYWQGDVTIIDLAQAVDTQYDEVYPLFARDVERVCRYFSRYGVECDAHVIANDMWTKHFGGN